MMGRWYADTLVVTATRLFWQLIPMMTMCKEPVIHLSLFLKARVNEKTLNTHGNHLAQLINGKAEDIFNEFYDVAKRAEWKLLVSKSKPEESIFFAKTSLMILLCAAASFQRRVLNEIAQFPYRLLRIVASPMDCDCKVRRTIAAEILGHVECSAFSLDITSIKFGFRRSLIRRRSASPWHSGAQT